MITIHRFPLTFLPGNSRAITTIAMPEGRIIRHFGMKGTDMCIWAQVDTQKPTQEYTFEIVGTGHEITENQEDYNNEYSYVGSTIDGYFVWHLFERP